MKQKSILSVFVMGIVLFAGIAAVSAYRGDPTSVGPNYSDERHNQMTQAFETNNYGLWSQLMDTIFGKHRVTERVNEENFNTFSQAHTAMMNGDIDSANELKASIGLGVGQQQRGQNAKGSGNYGNCPYMD